MGGGHKHVNFKFLIHPKCNVNGAIRFQITLYCITEFELEGYTCNKGNKSPCMSTQKFHIELSCFADSFFYFFF
jgi:hypothetical protein